MENKPDLAQLYATSSLYTPYENMQGRLGDYMLDKLGMPRSALGVLKEYGTDGQPPEHTRAEKVWDEHGIGEHADRNKKKFEEAVHDVGVYLHDKAGISEEEGEQQARQLALAMRNDYWNSFQFYESIRRATALPDHDPLHLREDASHRLKKVTNAMSALPAFLAVKTLEGVGTGPDDTKREQESRTIRNFVGRAIYRSLGSYGSVDPLGRAEPRVDPVVLPKDEPPAIIDNIKTYYQGTVLPVAQQCLGKS